MALSVRTSRALHDTLGDAAADDLVKWVTDVDASRIELREISELQVQRFASVLDTRFAESHRQTSAELHVAVTDLRKEMQAGFTDVRREMHASATDLRTAMHNRFNDLLKWSFVFWISTLVSVAALVRFLR